jgi:hypothetical protein
MQRGMGPALLEFNRLKNENTIAADEASTVLPTVIRQRVRGVEVGTLKDKNLSLTNIEARIRELRGSGRTRGCYVVFVEKHYYAVQLGYGSRAYLPGRVL